MRFIFFEKSRIIAAFALGFCLVMVAFPEITASAVKSAISLWLNTVVPMLLPFFFMANFLKKTGAVNRVSPKIYPFAMALLSGYPMGAKAAGDYYRAGNLDRNQLKRVLSYSMVTGPAFIVGAVGAGFLGSRLLGIIIALCHYGGALVNSLFYGDAFRPVQKKEIRLGAVKYYNLLTDAILDSFRSMALVLAYIMLFMICADLLQFSGVLSFLPTAEAAALAKGAMEMTVGLNALSMCQSPTTIKAVIAGFMVAFGGFSVMGQSMSMLTGCGISFTEIFVMKLSHGIISGILTFAAVSFVL